MLILFTRDFDAPLAGGGARRIAAGTELDLDPAKAAALIAAGIAEEIGPAPYLNPAGALVIPMNAPPRFRWWQGGQLPSETMRELFEERAAIMEYDGGLPRHEAERQAAERTGYQPDHERKGTDDHAAQTAAPSETDLLHGRAGRD